MVEYEKQRNRMLEEIEADVLYTRSLIGKDALDKRVMDAMEKVERHQFVPSSMADIAYDNSPLPIGHGQTISQPYIVALMTDLLALDRDDVALEIGTGCGYQTAILAELVKKVYSIESVPALAEQAAARLAGLGYHNVEVRIGDGYYGWKEHALFDGIIVTAAAHHTPPPLIEQLKPGGRMVIPVERKFAYQELIVVSKDAKGEVKTHDILPVSFVPLTGKHNRTPQNND